ncbi:MAG: carbohydrate binding domain-containing protein, partial [Bacteroidaceae bacterium]|nr:carbohydrate binding domain-containing protein [Bacteroidaceae bacterium]
TIIYLVAGVTGFEWGVTEIKEAFSSYGNTTFYLADEEGGQTFYVFRALGLGNQKCTDANAYKVGDEVVVCGKVVNYKGNTPETVQNKAYIYSINGKTDSGTDPVTPGDVKGDGSAADPFNIAAAIAKCQETGETATADVYYVKGIVSRLSSSYANTFWISEDGNAANEVEFYNGVGIDGATLQTGDVGVGDEVVVRGKLVNYKGNTPELEKGCEIVSIKKNANPTPDVEVTELVNGDFESWNGSIPTGWKSASTASNATLSQSTDAHGGNYAVLVGCTASANKRLATQEIKLAAGTYTFSFYAKSTVSDKSQCRPGYVPVTDGSVGTYMYGDYASIKSTEWTLVSYEFTLTEETTVCLVVMNPKASSYADSQDILVDDATLVKK